MQPAFTSLVSAHGQRVLENTAHGRVNANSVNLKAIRTSPNSPSEQRLNPGELRIKMFSELRIPFVQGQCERHMAHRMSRRLVLMDMGLLPVVNTAARIQSPIIRRDLSMMDRTIHPQRITALLYSTLHREEGIQRM